MLLSFLHPKGGGRETDVAQHRPLFHFFQNVFSCKGCDMCLIVGISVPNFFLPIVLSAEGKQIVSWQPLNRTKSCAYIMPLCLHDCIEPQGSICPYFYFALLPWSEKGKSCFSAYLGVLLDILEPILRMTHLMDINMGL